MRRAFDQRRWRSWNRRRPSRYRGYGSRRSGATTAWRRCCCGANWPRAWRKGVSPCFAGRWSGGFGADAAGQVAALLADVTNIAGLDETGRWLLECDTGDALLARLWAGRGGAATGCVADAPQLATGREEASKNPASTASG